MFWKWWAGNKLRRGRWLLAASAALIVPSLPLLWSLEAQPEQETVGRAVVPSTARGLSVPSSDKGRSGRDAAASPGANCDDPMVLVDRSHALPADYAPEDLVSLRNRGVPTLGGDALLRRKAAGALVRMVSAAAASGEELVVASAYRSYEDQSLSHARLVSVFGRRADKTSAPAGRSQHQLGTAVDFTSGAVGYEVHRSFGATTASRWLRSHAHEYGFVLSYPPGREAETGYEWEPWHYRHVGEKNARRVLGSEIGLQGYLQQRGVLPRC